MKGNDPTPPSEPRDIANGTSRLFAVRLWKEELDAASDYRGSVRDLATGASRGFRDWPAMVAFMVAQVEQKGRATRASEEVHDVG